MKCIAFYGENSGLWAVRVGENENFESVDIIVCHKGLKKLLKKRYLNKKKEYHFEIKATKVREAMS